MRLADTIFLCLAFRLSGVNASVPRLSPSQKCEMFAGDDPANVDLRRLYCPVRSSAFLKVMLRNWTELAETEQIDGRWRLVLPYIIKPKYIDESVQFWKSRSPAGGKPATEEQWIGKIRPKIEEAVKFFEPTTVLFKEYFQSDIDSGRFENKHYIVISDFYDKHSSGCTSDVGPSEYQDYIEVDVERCREGHGLGKEYHPGLIAHELMHVLGFMHEHQRPDRDQYLDVKVSRWNSFDYVKRVDGKMLTPYDPESITHYGVNPFIKIKSNAPDLIPNIEMIGQLEKLSRLDIEQINANYPTMVTLEKMCINLQVAPGTVGDNGGGGFSVSVKLQDLDNLFNFTTPTSLSIGGDYEVCGYEKIPVPRIALNVEKVLVQPLSSDGVKIASFSVRTKVMNTENEKASYFVGPVHDIGGWWVDTDSDEAVYGPCVTGELCELSALDIQPVNSIHPMTLYKMCLNFQVSDNGADDGGGKFGVAVKLQDFDYIFRLYTPTKLAVGKAYEVCGHEHIPVPSLNIEKVFAQAYSSDGVKIASFSVRTHYKKRNSASNQLLFDLTVNEEVSYFTGSVHDNGGWWLDTNSDEALYGPCVTGELCQLVPVV